MTSTTLVTFLVFAALAAVVVRRVLQMRPDPERLAAITAALSGGARLIDVRTPAEFGRGHLPGARNVPLQTLSDRLTDVGPVERDVVLYCASGARSRSATNTLQQAGFTRVLDGGPMSALAPHLASYLDPAEPSTQGLNRQQRRQQKHRRQKRPQSAQRQPSQR